jgi:hypothetical protein
MKMQLQLSVASIIIALCATNAFAGKIFGDVKITDKPAPEGMLITVQAVVTPAADKKETPPPAPIDSVKTDKVGSYKVVVKGEGKCKLTVYLEKKTATLEIFSYKEPTRYDLIVEEKDGKLTVRRK